MYASTYLATTMVGSNNSFKSTNQKFANGVNPDETTGKETTCLVKIYTVLRFGFDF